MLREAAQIDGYSLTRDAPERSAVGVVAPGLARACPCALGTVGTVARHPDTPSGPAVVVLNPEDEVTPESFAAWLDRRQGDAPVDPAVRAADTLAEVRSSGEV